jgi:autophagy-related protein 9
LFNDNVIDPTLWLPLVGYMAYLPLSLQYNIDYVQEKVVYNKRHDVKVHIHNVNTKAAELRWWFRAMAVVNLLLAPGIFVFRIAHFVFRYVDEWRRRPGTLAARQWDPWAQWKLREFCELDHVFESRLRRAHKPAVQYVDMFTSELSSILARFVLVICGGFVLVSLGLTFVFDEEYLVVELSPGRSVAFWMAAAGVVMALASAFVPDENHIFDPAEKLEKAAEHMHYYPDEWKGREGLPQTYKAVTQLFSYKLSVFAKELLSVLLTPYMLWFVLPGQARGIAEFFARTTRRCAIVGDACHYALFEKQEGSRVADNAKMELSMLHFHQQFPQWQPTNQWQRQLLTDKDTFLHQSLHRSQAAAPDNDHEESVLLS